MTIDIDDYAKYIENIVIMNQTLKNLNDITEKELGRVCDTLERVFNDMIGRQNSVDKKIGAMQLAQYGTITLLVVIILTLLKKGAP